MPVNAVRMIRRMRGGAQAHLLACDDGHWYVVKVRNNPQHRRILANEWIAAALLDYLRIPSPPVAVVNISPQFLEQNGEVYITRGLNRVEVEPGWHFGSRYPGDPMRQAVYDFVPDVLMDQIANPQDFLAIYVVDKWMGNTDSRQAIFFRARVRDAVRSPGEPRPKFVAWMIDHGFQFDGGFWRFVDSPLQGLYFRPLVYSRVRGPGSFEPWLEMVRHLPPELLDKALRQMPGSWIEGDEEEFERLLYRLMARQKRVEDLIAAARTLASNPFPNWT